MKDLTKLDLKKPPKNSGEAMAAFLTDLTANHNDNRNTRELKKTANEHKIPLTFLRLFVGGVK